MKQTKKGFTLVELIAVITLLALIMMLVIPNLTKLLSDNRNTQYEKYEDMMVEYTKTYPNYKTKSKICLTELKMKNISSNTTCKGYVTIATNSLKAFLSCNQGSTNVYQTTGYDASLAC